MGKKKVVLLGATGSIGESTLAILRKHPDKFQLEAIVANSNYKKIEEIAKEFSVPKVLLSDKNVRSKITNDAGYYFGEKEIISVLEEIESDVVISAIVGIAGLKPTLAACKNTKILGLANKESVVCGGRIFLDKISEMGVKIIPLDSEHNAIFQIFSQKQRNMISNITLTASGGPFLGYNKNQLAGVKLKEALKHPNWQMGPKNTIDSATLMNKGLEVIEAAYLFDLKPEKIKVLVHPQSVIHGMVDYEDGSTLAHLSLPSMQVPISYALDYPNRLKIDYNELDLAKLSKLDFYEPDNEVFPLLQCAYKSLRDGAKSIIALNIANEVAVQKLLAGAIEFYQLPEFIITHLEKDSGNAQINTIYDVLSFAEQQHATLAA